MTDKPPRVSREDRLKAALRDNLRRRKTQAQARTRARAEPPAPDEPGRSDGVRARSRDDARKAGTGEHDMADGGRDTALADTRAAIAALIARDLGFGDLAGLGADERAVVEAATASMIERSSAIVPDHADPIIADVRLGRLLAAYRNLEQLRIDERETLLAGEGGGREDDA